MSEPIEDRLRDGRPCYLWPEGDYNEIDLEISLDEAGYLQIGDLHRRTEYADWLRLWDVANQAVLMRDISASEAINDELDMR